MFCIYLVGNVTAQLKMMTANPNTAPARRPKVIHRFEAIANPAQTSRVITHHKTVPTQTNSPPFPTRTAMTISRIMKDRADAIDTERKIRFLFSCIDFFFRSSSIFLIGCVLIILSRLVFVPSVVTSNHCLDGTRVHGVSQKRKLHRVNYNGH